MADQSRPAMPSMAADNSDDEWEYEYSTTETETHYVTIDLSIPEYVDRRDDTLIDNPQDNDGGAPTSQPSQEKILPVEDDEEDYDDDEEIHGYDDDEDEEEEFGRRRASRKRKVAPEDGAPVRRIADPTQIQILDLHEDHPIISYRGTIFSCNWTSPIGTELMFTPRDDNDKNPIQTLRNLPQNIDLLCASSARIACTPTDHKRRKSNTQENVMRQVRATNRFAIPMYSDTHAQRRPQAHFIETLMAIKRRRGERDEVTVYAQDTRHNRVYDDHEEEKNRRKKVRQNAGSKKRYARSQKRKGRPPPRGPGYDGTSEVVGSGGVQNGGEGPATGTGASQSSLPRSQPATLFPAISGMETGVNQE